MSKRTIFISDIHGTIFEFNCLLDKLNYDSAGDRLIIIGDTNDRGEDSVGVIRKCREMKLECCMGNHDKHILTWVDNDRVGGKAYYKDLSEEDIQYIRDMPLYIEGDDFVALHAGIRRNIPLNQQSEYDLLHLRYLNEQQELISLRKINKLGKAETGAKLWSEYGPFPLLGGKDIVCGHSVMDDVRIDRYADGTAVWFIDTGAVFGGKLSALIWENKKIVQVAAKKVYYQSSFVIR
jgi:serine/threonine protein phosphatase 1